MALKHLFSGMAGIPAFFKGGTSGSYGNVVEGTSKWLDGSKDKAARMADAETFRGHMNRNTNLSPAEVTGMKAGYAVRNMFRAGYENTSNVIGAGTSAAGGAAGVFARDVLTASGQMAGGAAKMAASGAVLGAKSGVSAVKGSRHILPGASRRRKLGNMDADQKAIFLEAEKKRRKTRLDRVGAATKATGSDAVNMGKALYNATGTKTFHALTAVAAGGAIFGSASQLDATIGSPLGDGPMGKLVGSAEGPIDNAFDSGLKKGKSYHTMQQVASNMSVSNNGGGAFIRDLAPASAPVDDNGASGDLVFALHALRNGG